MDLRELREISVFIGKNKDLVQGPGGNTSLKSGNLIAVKASGTRLEAALDEDIFCQLTLDQGVSLTPNLRPSIEAGFHREIQASCVVHVHSVGSLTWGCRIRSKDDDDILSANKILLAPYLRPGDAITRYLAGVPNLYSFEAVLLQNHGLITWDVNPRLALAKLVKIETLLLELAISKLGFKEETHQLDKLDESNFFTPDHAVFSETTNIKIGSFEHEVLSAINKALNFIPVKTKLTFIEKNEVEALQNWEAEKYRKNMNQS